ncbi:MAG: exosortase system-associated protein, TIGR04073 family [Candidatus Omnitrophica bacterium]|nr:exosortase system-associated protein, TIGR04073 family [Candidatus Omnitrophota bacterium]MBU1128751.1 exosortase system-associated protein, TIGR04073 family [Candidatus Omnitrophota bacterium]MBU1657047.1 exosortase system-associated protein, TIGR04073 family [Candidatus Omnitrophota bacterium]MBU1783975.1 exosortase system-associated protein, TIGR04073 family [Candidatus Omnitrophota bacterium]MBU1851256.1 exosortase system-associated protein, TIGR04073 family [Candidatus Omnitrophota bact
MRAFKMVVVCLMVVAMLGMATQCYAQDPAKKLGRGLANILTGWVELPKNIYDTSVEDNVLAGITMGLAKGIGMFIVRTGAGVYEVVMFPFPIPEDYQPVLEPEFVFSE